MEKDKEPASDTANSAGEACTPTVQSQRLLDRLQAGDDAARNELIGCACARLERLTRKMLRSWDACTAGRRPAT